MDVGHLSTEELDYELKIRGIHNVSTIRTKIVALRDILDREAKGTENSPKDSTMFIPAGDEVQNCKTAFNDISQHVQATVESNAPLLINQTLSRLFHLQGRLERIRPTSNDQYNAIAGMLDEVYDNIYQLQYRRNNNTQLPPKPASRSSSVPKTNSNRSQISHMSNNSIRSHIPENIQDGCDEEEGAVGGFSPSLPTIEQLELNEVDMDLLSFKEQKELTQQFVKMYRQKLRDRPSAVSPQPKPRSDSGGMKQQTTVGVQQHCSNQQYKSDFQGVSNAAIGQPNYSKEKGYNFNSALNLYREPIMQQRQMHNGINSANIFGDNSIPNSARQYFQYDGRISPTELPRYEDLNHHNGGTNSVFNPPQYSRPNIQSNPYQYVNSRDLNQRNRQYNADIPLNNTRSRIGPLHLTRKTVPVHHWRCNFSGDGKGSHLYDFLSQLSVFQRSEGVSKAELFDSIIHLLSGRARLWYLATREQYASWEELISALKTEFLPENYDFILLNDISNRNQKQNESFAEFITQMLSAFKCLSIELSEQYKLFIVKRNLLSKYSEAIAPFRIQTIAQLAQICRSIDDANTIKKSHSLPFQQFPSMNENSRNRWGREVNAVDNSSSNATANPNVANNQEYTGGEEIHSVNHQSDNPFKIESQDICAVQRRVQQNQQHRPSVRSKCWNCVQEGHFFQNCPAAKGSIFCYTCGFRGVITRNCPKCRGNEERNPVLRGGNTDSNQSQTSQANQNQQ